MLKLRDIDQSEAPLLDHLIELRGRLLRCVIALGLAFVVCLNFADDIFGFLVRPLTAAFPQGEGRLIYTKDGARRLDNDLVIIPAGSYEKPRSWFNSVVVLALVGVVASVVYWRRKAHASAGDRVK